MARVVAGLPTSTTDLFWTIELALFALVNFMVSKFSGGADLNTMVLVFVAPIITYGHMKVQSGYSAPQIRVNSKFVWCDVDGCDPRHRRERVRHEHDELHEQCDSGQFFFACWSEWS